MWAKEVGGEFGEQEIVKRNFSKAFLDKMPESVKSQDPKMEDFDFTAIKEHLEVSREQQKARTTEEKKLETQKNQEIQAQYKYCIWDGRLQPVGGAISEPPGIFRGRGAHPNAGMLKERIVPEFVQLNVGENAPIPVCPIPGHSW